MSPEQDTLEQLCGGDLPLKVVGQIFGGDLVCAARALEHQYAQQLIRFRRHGGGGDQELAAWELRALLADRGTWEGDAYWVSLTDAGVRAAPI